MSDIPLSLYCHLPWCIEKCPYCDFNSFKLSKQDSMERYTNALCQDLMSSSQLINNRPIISIFFGGGTPSLFPSTSIEKIMSTIQAHYQLSENIEITLEMNPSSCETKKLAELRNIGINRLSIGVQSFNDASLKALGRVHDAKMAHEAIVEAQKNDFDAINIDIMYGLPHQTEKEALLDLEQAIQYQTAHLSWYELTIEANTYFAKHRPHIPDCDILDRMDKLGQVVLKDAGFERYEVSAYARQRKRCTHNMNYWNFGDYLGCGNGASSKITDTKGIWRFQKYRSPALYQEAPTKQCLQQQVELDEQLFEYMLNKLRLTGPFHIAEISRLTQLDRGTVTDKLQPAIQQGMLKVSNGYITKTTLGHSYLNDLQALFLRSNQRDVRENK